jgi:hypothetical protein
MDLFVKQKAIEIRQQNKIKLPDAIIAATAIQKGLSLVTADIGCDKYIRYILIINDFTDKNRNYGRIKTSNPRSGTLFAECKANIVGKSRKGR